MMYASSREQMLNYLSVCRPEEKEVWQNSFLDSVLRHYDYERELTEKQWFVVEDIYSKTK